MKLMATIALSGLVSRGITKDSRIRRSLASLTQYAENEKDPAFCKQGFHSTTPFCEQVKDLTKRFYSILRDSVRIAEHEYDPEMTADLLYRIALGYTNAPDLRVTWLESLREKHIKNNNFAEAANCKVHVAALISEYLKDLEAVPGMPMGAHAFKPVTVNVSDEIVQSSEATARDEDSMCGSEAFTPDGLFGHLSQAVIDLKKAELYETANEVYKLMIPRLENIRDYARLADVHGDLQEIFSAVKVKEIAEARCFGTYYRVGFFGKEVFADMHATEFIYKEPKITMLPELTQRLLTMYNGQTEESEKKVKLIQDSGEVDISALDPSLGYIQITHVDPHFDDYENKKRTSHFDRSTRLSKFVFETPFTDSGKAHGATDEQKKRKTILATDHCFPYIKKRLRVVDREEIVLQPIEVGLDLIVQRAKMLDAEVKANPPSTKTLQIVLQGSVRLQVNAGPLEICRTFLGSPDKYDKKQIASLRLAFRNFLKSAKDCLDLNGTLITAVQTEYHQDLTLGYEEVREEILPYIKGDMATIEARRAKAVRSEEHRLNSSHIPLSRMPSSA
eukprot:TRINITY_DN25153_c0_g1_i1.p1 TRINITY_DN25153_c0_g1~~TRINITY_DN25153_c0_g1_i1.p1  ORF type:complete len:654 (-),score=191.97 TRINITY_DN25153_c0_g1_i1:76-1761(-)